MLSVPTSRAYWGDICRCECCQQMSSHFVLQVLSGMFSSTTGHIDDRWQAFMKFQIARARQYFADAEAGVDHLDTDARWPVWSALILYRSGSPHLHILIMNATSHKVFISRPAATEAGGERQLSLVMHLLRR